MQTVPCFVVGPRGTLGKERGQRREEQSFLSPAQKIHTHSSLFFLQEKCASSSGGEEKALFCRLCAFHSQHGFSSSGGDHVHCARAYGGIKDVSIRPLWQKQLENISSREITPLLTGQCTRFVSKEKNGVLYQGHTMAAVRTSSGRRRRRGPCRTYCLL